MADSPYVIQTIQMQGFRAYLKPKTFDFSQKRCLAIFAPNGGGKSSVIDALEFFFSRDGTLDRLGIRAINNQAGVLALAHNLADDQKIVPRVSISFLKGKEKSDGSRDASGGRRQQPNVALTVNACFTVSPIIRGHELRSFVESHSSEQRYTDVATWLQLGPLVEVQKNLRTLRTQIRASADDRSVEVRIDSQLDKETTKAVSSWDVAKILDYVNSVVIAPLDKTLQMKALNETDQGFVTLSDRGKTEENQIGLAGLRQMRDTASFLYEVKVDAATGGNEVVGGIPAFELAVRKKFDAAAVEAVEQDKAASAAFSSLWKVAEPLFADGVADLDSCPICATPIAETEAGSMVGVRNHLTTHLRELAEYAKAKNALDDATLLATRSHTRLIGALPALPKLLGEGYEALKTANGTYFGAIEGWAGGAAPTSGDLTSALSALLTDLDAKIADIEARQGDHTYAKAKTKIERFLGLQVEHVLAERTRTELDDISHGLTAQATFIGAEIRKKVQALLDTLQAPANEIYRQIQGVQAVPIRLELPSEEDANQQRLHMVIDFAKNRTGVQPAGYLSDSQIHSVALAFRLAAIKCFNIKAPIIALDDIVTSYYADHRRTIAGVIANGFSDFQVIITTHDERFFNYMKDQLLEKDWNFTRITKLDPEFGPRFADHKINDDMIEARWNKGESAANEMRQSEEEWLLKVCRDFGVSVRIRPLEKAYSYERSELAGALLSFLKGAKLEPQLVAGVNNRFLSSINQGVIENFGSHFQDALYGDGSIGDERTRWEEFKAFRSQFVCPKCRGTKFKRPGLAKPVCASDGCETQFDFVPAATMGAK